MTTILNISGHGENKDGSFDPGALGYIKKGEHKYFEQDLFKAMKKYLPKNHNMVFFSEYNVYDYGNLVSLAKKYGNDTIVVEWHFDAGVPAASGGHVIVHKNYSPDNTDLKIRNVIKKHIGVRYNHKGETGISGRTDLANVKRAASGDINYRLVELGFGTSPKDSNAMLNKIDAIAKDFVVELVGSATDVPVVNKTNPVEVVKPVGVEARSVEQLAREVVQGMHGSGQDRKDALGSKYDAVQKRVNEITSVEKPVPAKKSISTLVKETKAGVHGNGEARKKSLGSNYNAVMDIINGKKTVEAVAPKFNLPVANYWVKKPQFSGNGVLTVQKALSSIYYYPDKGAKNNGCDGYYGAKTADAVARFQSVNGLKADGIYGNDTRKKINALVNK